MTLRIAFCGPNGTLNESLSEVVRDMLYDPDKEVVELTHPVMRLTEITQWEPEHWAGHNLDWMNLWASSLRRMELEAAREVDVVLSSSCGVDQVCLQAAWLGEQSQAQATAPSLLGPDGSAIIGQDGVWINRSQAVFQAMLNSSEEELYEWWDFVYAVLPLEAELDAPLLPLLIQYRNFLSGIPIYQDIIMLPEHQDAATDALRNEVDKWKIASSS